MRMRSAAVAAGRPEVPERRADVAHGRDPAPEHAVVPVDMEVDEARQDRRVAELDRPPRLGVELAADRDDLPAAHEHRAGLVELAAVEEAVRREEHVAAQVLPAAARGQAGCEREEQESLQRRNGEGRLAPPLVRCS